MTNYKRELKALRRQIDDALDYLGRFTDPADVYYGLSTYRPDLAHARNGVQRAIEQAKDRNEVRSVLPILAGLGFNEFFPANLLNAEYTVALKVNENPGDQTWLRGWNEIHGVAVGFDQIVAACYADLGL